ncbi:MAG: hypothetical protein KA436_08675 [Oligoflexales bacterium]|nr:hypothetical protein [Oligoflexales bacterium]
MLKNLRPFVIACLLVLVSSPASAVSFKFWNWGRRTTPPVTNQSPVPPPVDPLWDVIAIAEDGSLSSTPDETPEVPPVAAPASETEEPPEEAPAHEPASEEACHAAIAVPMLAASGAMMNLVPIMPTTQEEASESRHPQRTRNELSPTFVVRSTPTGLRSLLLYVCA